MAGTPVSNSTPYCTAQEFLKRADFRTVADNLSDNDKRPTLPTILDSSSVEGNRLYVILMDASGEVESACLLGGRYTPADLAALTGNQAQFLKRLVTDLAIPMVYRRRPDLNTPVPDWCTQAKNILNALAAGDRIFGIQETIDATHAEIEVDSAADVEARQMPTYTASRFFGTRNNRLY